LEIGPGDCAVALEVAKHVAFVYAVDVSEYITKGIVFPVNFQLVMSDGSSIPVPAGSVHLAYSNQVMEHLHPDDALEQLRNVFQGLAPGGRYICVTPNRLCGPMDISRYFDSVPTGFHLKEYSIGELRRLFQAAGFRSVRQYAALRGVQVEVPTFPYLALEALLNPLPFELRRRIAALRVVRRLLNVRIVGLK
jgi:SAM-dependent methyltransferase